MLREVYVPIENEVIDGVPVPFIEFNEFWNTHKNDDVFIMTYLDESNRVVD